MIRSVISESQSAFVKDRQILDDILITNEIVDNACSLKKILLFKIDFEKAYILVDWRYLDDVMYKMNFPTLWQKWILECIIMAIASILVNGSPTNEFKMERGILQGGSFSHFSF